MTSTESPGKILTLFDCNTATGVGLLLDYPPSLTRSTATSSSSRPPSSTAPPVVTVTDTSSPAPAGGVGGPPAGPIAGGVVGGVAVLALIGTGAFLLLRRKRGPDGAGPPAPVSALAEKGTYAPGGATSPGGSVPTDPRYSYPASYAYSDGQQQAAYPQTVPPATVQQQPGYNVYSPHNSVYMGQAPAGGSPPPNQGYSAGYAGTSPAGGSQTSPVNNGAATYGQGPYPETNPETVAYGAQQQQQQPQGMPPFTYC